MERSRRLPLVDPALAQGCFTPPQTPPPVPSHRLESLVGHSLAHQVTVLRAPAGFGKTTFLRALADRWREGSSLEVWCGLGIRQVDSTQLLAALTARLARSLQPPSDPSHVLAKAVQEAARGASVMLVLDDAHQVPADSALWVALDNLFCALPGNVRVAVGTRATLPLRLGRLRANGWLREVGAADLRLSLEETLEVVQAECGSEVPLRLVEAIYSRTAGWPACVRLLAGLVARCGLSEAELVAPRAGMPDDVRAYIAEEVASFFPKPTMEAMRKIAVLEEFDVRIAARLCGHGAAGAAVELATSLGALEASGSGARRRYRLHPLLREFLADHQCFTGGSGGFARSHSRAARVLCEAGETAAAVDQFILAGQEQQAAHLVEELAQEMLRAGGVGRLDAWLGQFSSATVLQRPALLALQAEVDWLRGRYWGAYEKLEACRRLAVVDGLPGRATELAMLKARCALDLGRKHLIEQAIEEVGAQGGDGDGAPDWASHSLQGVVLALGGDVANARERLGRSLAGARARGAEAECMAASRLGVLYATVVLDAATASEWSARALRLAGRIDDVALTLHMLSNRAADLLLAGEYAEAEERLAEGVGVALEHGLLCIEPYIESNLAAVHAGRGELAQACARLQGVVRCLEDQDAAAALAEELLGLAHLVRLRGSPVRGLGVARRSQRVGKEAGARYAVAGARVEEAACLAAQGRAREQLRTLGPIARECFDSGMGGYGARARYQEARCLFLGGRINDAHAVLEQALGVFQDLNYLHYLIVEAHGDPSVLLFALDSGVEVAFAEHILSRTPRSVRSQLLKWLSSSDKEARARALRLVESNSVEDSAVAQAADRLMARSMARKPCRFEGRRARLRLYTLGGFMVELDGRRLDRSDWPRAKARELLRMLAAQRNHAVAKDVLIARFWPDSPEQRASNSAYVLVNALKRALEPDLEPNARSFFVVLDEGAYALVPDTYWIDSEEYEWLVQQGEEALAAGKRRKAREYLLAADRLYAGDYMADDLYGDFFFADRERLRQIQQRVLRLLVDIDSSDTGRQAVPHYLRRMTELDPWNEDMWEELVKAHMILGDPKGAREAYLQSCKALADGDEDAMPSGLAKLGRSLGRQVGSQDAVAARS